MNLVPHTFKTLHLDLWLSRLPKIRFSFTGIKSNLNKLDPLFPLRQRLDGITIQDSAFAHRICKLIPSQCPFEREVKVLGHTLVKIPPMCKLNPFYNELVFLRFRAMCYLSDTCGEDISIYC
ncbi:MAG: Mo-dependent nitrogenase C-terminal domain-containing protein [Cyanobacteria bacterium J06631_6]